MLHVWFPETASTLEASQRVPLRPAAPIREPAAASVIATDFLRKEIRRVGAPVSEIRAAFAFASGLTAHDARAYDALTPRMRRLVDLATVAGGHLQATEFEQNAAE